MTRGLLAAILIFALASRTPIFGQGCCSQGNSLMTAGHPTLKRGTILLVPGVDYISAENPTRSKAAATLAVAYGITARLGVSIRTDYSCLHSKVRQRAVVYNDSILFPAQTLLFDNNGFGDGSVAVQYVLVPMDLVDRHELKLGVDGGVPWGPDQREKGGAVLPTNMQSGNGGFTAGAFIAYAKGYPSVRLELSATASGRLKFRTRRGEDPGNEGSLQLSLVAGPFWRTRGSLSLNARGVAATYDQNGDRVNATSGVRLDILPSLDLVASDYFTATVGGVLPLWRDDLQKRYGNTFEVRGSLLIFLPALGN